MEYQVKVLEDVVTEPVTLAEVKSWCQIDADYSSEDSTLAIMISSAREKLEGELNVFFGVKTIEVQFSGSFFRLPYGPTGNILSFYNVGDDPYADIEYTLHGLTFKSMCIGHVNASEWFYPIAGSYPELWRNLDHLNINTYNVMYTTGYITLPRLLKEALLIQIDYDLKARGMPGMSALSPVAVQKAQRFSQNLVL
jgi:hypothetical protein